MAFTLGLNGPTLLQNFRKLPAEVSATTDQYLSWVKEDQEWTGNWSTFPEGIANMGDMKLSDGIDLKIAIRSTNGEINGEITSTSVCKHFPAFDFLLVRGKVNGKSANLTIWDIVRGETTTFAEVAITRQNDVITVRPVSGSISLFPSSARLGKHPYLEGAFMQGACNRTANPARSGAK